MDRVEIKALRTRLGATQKIMAKKCGVHIRNYQKFESGALNPRRSVVLLLEHLAREADAEAVWTEFASGKTRAD